MLYKKNSYFSYVERIDKNNENENINAAVCNEAQQMTSITVQDGSSSEQEVMRVSDASGHYEKVLIRRRRRQIHQQQSPKGDNHHRLSRPLAVLSGLFKSNRENSVNHEENLPKFSSCGMANGDGDVDAGENDNKKSKKLKKRASWNIFKSKRKNQRTDIPSFQHFQEPLNIERMSLPFGRGCAASHTADLEWYDLNKEEMSLFEARMSDIVKDFNNFSQTSGGSECELDSIYRCHRLGRPSTISSNILWSHNLSMSCQSSNVNASNINLLGANINKDQLHSDVYIEDGELLAQNILCSESRRNSSFISTDSDGYAVMQPVILSKKCIEPRNYDSDGSNHLSSGFGSDSEPQKSMPFINSPPTSDFSDAYPTDKFNECSPTLTSTIPEKNMQNIPSKRRLRIKSRKLLGMLHMPSPPISPSASQTEWYVMPIPRNKSPPPPPSIPDTKRVYKGTPRKIRSSKQTTNEKDIIQPFQSLQI